MLRYEPYFFKNGALIVAVNRDTTRKLPKPWPCLLNGMDYHVEKYWTRYFAEFLLFNGEDPEKFEIHWPGPGGYVQRIAWDPDWKCWGRKFVDRKPYPYQEPLIDSFRGFLSELAHGQAGK